MKHLTQQQRNDICSDLRRLYGAAVTRQQLFDYQARTGMNVSFLHQGRKVTRVGRGLYGVPAPDGTPSDLLPAMAATPDEPTVSEPETETEVAEMPEPIMTHQQPDLPEFSMSVATASATQDLVNANIADKMAALRQGASILARVPKKAKVFVPFGDYDMIEQVINRRRFFPIFISGPSGNGKTFGVQQACARLGREYIRCAITTETDEDDLLGGFRLRDGNTVFEPGPVIVAMLRGSVLLLDELDKASAKIMCLQPILEGNAITLKKLGVTIEPADGFTVFATANTKGRGDDSGQFVTSMILDEALLERFPVTIEQEYPDVKIEKKILTKHFMASGYAMTPHANVFFDTLAKWAQSIRETYAAGGTESLISTRRLCHIVSAYAIFSADPQADAKAIEYCVNRFDAKTKESWKELYNALAPDDAGTADNAGAIEAPEGF
jgi:hypothetical protein